MGQSILKRWIGRAEIKAKTLSKHEELAKNKGYHFMDKKEPGKEVSEDMTRESLIALSYRLPETDLALGFSPENLSSESLVVGIDGDGAERYRSKLISISYSESPDVKTVPVAPGEFKG